MPAADWLRSLQEVCGFSLRGSESTGIRVLTFAAHSSEPSVVFTLRERMLVESAVILPVGERTPSPLSLPITDRSNIAMKQGESAEAAIDGVNETIDSITNRCNYSRCVCSCRFQPCSCCNAVPPQGRSQPPRSFEITWLETAETRCVVT